RRRSRRCRRRSRRGRGGRARRRGARRGRGRRRVIVAAAEHDDDQQRDTDGDRCADEHRAPSLGARPALVVGWVRTTTGGLARTTATRPRSGVHARRVRTPGCGRIFHSHAVRSVGSVPVRLRSVGTWALRVVWLTLPLTAGTAASDAIATWDDAPRVVAAVLLFGAWGAVSVGLLAPRPAGLTIVRGIAPVFALLAIVALATGETRGLAGAAAIVATAAAGVLAMLPDYAVAAVNGVAYGDEMRVPLQVPPALFLGPLPLVRLLVAGALAAAPLL